jgi:hypothetical protein
VICFPGGFFFPDGRFFDFFVAWGTQKRDKNVLRGRASKKFPLADFFYCVFGRFSIRGTQKRDKKSRYRTRV